jgi:hypothetical protein
MVGAMSTDGSGIHLFNKLHGTNEWGSDATGAGEACETASL